MFYHLYHARTAAQVKEITVIRVEQIAPFPYDLVGPAVKKFPAAELVWVQEEPKNQGESHSPVTKYINFGIFDRCLGLYKAAF